MGKGKLRAMVEAFNGEAGDAAVRALQQERTDIRIERTGNIYSFASTEYRVTYPDGHVGTIWSPPWHELDDPEEDVAALEYARKQFADGIHKA